MKIESIRVQGYRSLGDLTFEPGAFTVLVGPNNAGKSNIVDALGFLSDVYAHGIRQALDVRGGFENVAFREDGIPRAEISFEAVASVNLEEGFRISPPVPEAIDAELQPEEARFQLRHLFTVRGHGEPLISEFKIEYEEIQLDLITHSPTLLLRAIRRGIAAEVTLNQDRTLSRLALPFFANGPGTEMFIESMSHTEARPWDLVIARIQTISPLFLWFTDLLGDMKIYQLQPDVCRFPSPPTSVAELGVNGANLAALVKNLQDQSPEAWASILESMTAIMPDLEEIEVLQTTDKLWTLVFEESGMGRRWTADEVSDGTIRALALFTTLYDPHGSLLAIEEPENSLHPWVLRELVSGCRKVSSGSDPKEIALTTHSPVLIDQLYPSEITVVWKEGGQTKLSPLLELEPEIEEPWADGKIKLSGLLDSGLLRQTVPVP